MKEFLPIFACVTIVVFFLAIIRIIVIRTKRSAIGGDEKDFIDSIIDLRKKPLEIGLGTITFQTYILIGLFCPLITFAIAYILLKDFAVAMILGIVAIAAPEVYLRVSRNRQKRLFEERYARALRVMASSLRAGLTVSQAVNEVIRSPFVHETIKNGFLLIASDLKVSVSVKDAFRRYAELTRSVDAHDVAAAIAMQAEIGGSEGEVIEKIANSIRVRILTRSEVKTIFSGTDVLVLAMDIVPFLSIAVIYFMAPSFLSPYFESGLMTIIFFLLLALMLLGSVVCRVVAARAKGGVR